MEKLINLYQQGRIVEALEKSRGDSTEVKAFFNYVDSTAFESPLTSMSTNEYLQELLYGQYPDFVVRLQFDLKMLDKILYPEMEIPASDIPEKWHHIIDIQEKFSDKILRFKKERLRLDYPRPYWPISYPTAYTPQKYAGMPLFIMEPVNINWKNILTSPAVFLFYDVTVLWQCLQFEEVLQALLDKRNIIIVGRFYPNELLEMQDFNVPENLEAVRVSDNPVLAKHEDTISQSVMNCLREYGGSNDAADYLHLLNRDIHTEIRYQHLGKRRSLALMWQRIYRIRRSAHSCKGINPPKIMTLEHAEKEIIDSCKPIEKRIIKNKKLRLAHVMSMLSDDNTHAPTRILRSFLQYHDKEKYELYVYSNEFLLNRKNEYPYFDVCIFPSRNNAKELLSELKNYYIADNQRHDYIQTAYDIAYDLSRREIDIVFLHEMSPIVAILAHITDVPYRVYFNHGWGDYPLNGDFELMIFSNDEMKKQVQEHHQDIKIVSRAFSVDCRIGWEDKPYSKEFFGLSEKNIMLTTISNHFTTRLSDDMCWAIGEILRENPEAYYVAVGGYPRNIEELRNKIGVPERISFIGPVDNPSQFARTADLYLNEFPIGSGLGILDAMASGTPAVAMNDTKGPSAGRYGAIYMGRGVNSCNKKDYVDLACRLIKDKAMYSEWSRCALRRYEEIADVAKYVQDIETFTSDTLLKSSF